MKTLLKYLKPFYNKMALGFIIKTFGTILELLIPYILTHILENVIDKSVKDIFFWGGLMILCSSVACVSHITANRMAAKVSKNFAEAMRKDLFFKTLKLSAAQTDRFTIPSLESRITTDTYNVHAFINMMQRMGVRAPILLMGGIIITVFMDAKLSLVMIALVPVLFASVMFVRTKGVPLYTKVQKSIDKMIRVVREDTQGIRVIKALSKTQHEHERYASVNKLIIKNECRARIIMGTIHPIMNVCMNLASVAAIALGAIFVSKGISKPETLIAFMQYFIQISMALMVVTRLVVMYTKSSASAKRIEEILLAKEDISCLDKKDFPDIDTSAHIIFDKVCFSYNKKLNNLDDISFELKKGSKLGIIGATGSGKSTLIKLLLRFYDADKGEIYINGQNIKTIPEKVFYANFGTAMQNDFLYAETIMENIKFGRDISDEDVFTAAKIAQAHDFINELTDGYMHLLSPRGTNISGGQKQRILISRALAAKPDIIIFDDSSSALDYKTDAALRKAISENLSDTTIITVAQRVSSIKNCDLILVLDEGKIIGKGSHEELINTCSTYKEISDSQMGGAFVE